MCRGLFCWSQGLQYTPILVFPVDISKFLRVALLYNSSGGCIRLSYHSTVKSAGLPFWFCPSTYCVFSSKTFTLHKKFFTIMWQNNFFLAWIDSSHAFDFRMFCKNINSFRLSWKLHLKCCTSNYVISQVKRLSSSALAGSSRAFNFRVDVLCE